VQALSSVGHPAPQPTRASPAAAAWSYVAPRTLAEAVAALGPDARILAGGQTLIPQLRLGLSQPRLVVDINRLPGLSVLAEEDGMLRIGALVRDAELERSSLIRDRHPLLFETVRRVADPLSRSRSTVAGSLASGDPAGDWAPVLSVLDACIDVAGPDGSATLPVRGLQVGPFQTRLRPDQLIVEVRVPLLQPGQGAAYVKIEQRAGDYAVGGAAVCLTLVDDVITAASIGLANAGPSALNAPAAAALIGRRIDDEDALAAAARLAGDSAEPSTDLRGTAADKRQLLVVLVRRALRRAAERAQATA
jgi:carbon-monoxide dehydrogenase medium subunit